METVAQQSEDNTTAQADRNRKEQKSNNYVLRHFLEDYKVSQEGLW